MSTFNFGENMTIDLADRSLWLGDAEAVDHPDHYHASSGIEAIDVIETWGLNFSLGNAIKYISRCGHKDSANPNKAIEDLLKAIWYLEREVARRKSEEGDDDA